MTHESRKSESDSQEPNPLLDALADLVRRLSDHWFGPAACWGFTKRFLCAGAGSVSLFLMVILDFILQDTGQLTDIRSPIFLLVIALVALTIFLIPCAWFAWLVSWENMHYGPIRLYLSGFTLPYLLFWLVSKLPAFGLPIPGQ